MQPFTPDIHRNQHLLDLQARNFHTANNIREQGHHIIVAHGHVGHNFLEGDLLGRMVLVLLSTARQLEP